MPVLILSKNHFRGKYSQLLALIYYEQGYQASLKLDEQYTNMFNRMINELVLPSAEIQNTDYFIGFANLIADSITEIYHIIMTKGNDDLNRQLRIRKGILKNDLLYHLLLSVI